MCRELHFQLLPLANLPTSVSSTVTAQETGVFEVTFEELLVRLEQLPGTYVEPDGSFVMSGCVGGQGWRLYGMIYDRPVGDPGPLQLGRVCWCEFRGSCPKDAWLAVIRCLATSPGLLRAFLPHESRMISMVELVELWGLYA